MERVDYYDCLDAFLSRNGIKHFSARELVQPSIAYVRKLFKKVAVHNELAPTSLWSNALKLCQLLEEIREYFGGRPVYINSGYRAPAYNRAIRGARASQHMEFTAADITIEGVSPSEVFKYMESQYPRGTRYGRGRYSTFTHVDVRPSWARWKG